MRPCSRRPPGPGWRPRCGAAWTPRRGTRASSCRPRARSRRGRARRSCSGSWTRPTTTAGTSGYSSRRGRRPLPKPPLGLRRRSRGSSWGKEKGRGDDRRALCAIGPWVVLPAEWLLGRGDAVGATVPASTARAARSTPPATRPAGTPPAARAGRTRVRDVDGDLAPVEILAVQLRDRPLGLLRGRHLDEAEAPRLARELVRDHGSRLHGPALREVFP